MGIVHSGLLTMCVDIITDRCGPTNGKVAADLSMTDPL